MGMWLFGGPRSYLQHLESPGSQRVEIRMGKSCWDASVDGELCGKVSAWKKDAAAPNCESMLPQSESPSVLYLA